MKRLVISDTHIGYEKTNIPKLEKFFNQIDRSVDLLVLNGDILDLWRMSYTDIVEEYGDLMEQIRLVSVFTPTIWIRGNHDYYVPQREFPHIEFMKEYDTKDIHIEHGHRFDIKQRAFGWGYWAVIRLLPTLYQRFFKSPSEIITEEDKNIFLPMHKEARYYALTHHKKVVVVGHSHNPLCRYYDGYTVADSGDFIDSCSYVKIVDDGDSILTTVERID